MKSIGNREDNNSPAKPIWPITIGEGISPNKTLFYSPLDIQWIKRACDAFHTILYIKAYL